jgi:hypothetical protein
MDENSFTGRRFAGWAMVGLMLGAARAGGGETAQVPAVVLSGTATFASSLLDSIQFGGFVSTSYFYNFDSPAAGRSIGRANDAGHNEFAINKLKLNAERPVAASADKWDAGFRADVIIGQDAALTQSSGLSLGAHGDLEQAYVVVNVPVWNGLQVSAGKWVTLMGVEVIEETANPNLSMGNQCLFLENWTAMGVQVAHRWGDAFDVQLRLTNGWDVARDNNGALSWMGRAAWTPDADTTIALLGYGGPEQAGNTSNWRRGAELVVNRNLTPELNAWLQIDYGREDGASINTPGAAAEWSGAGLFMAWDFNEKMGLAWRIDCVNDRDGARTSGAPLSAPMPANGGQTLISATVTLNAKPVKGLMVRPELRWDHSSLDGVFGGRRDQITAGVGTSYSF